MNYTDEELLQIIDAIIQNIAEADSPESADELGEELSYFSAEAASRGLI